MLYLVPTPIGNLEDLTFRALRILREVEYILAEDTRTTRRLCQHYEIQTPLRAYHAHNEHGATQGILEDLQQGKHIAVVTDAGTPGISDPGYLLVRACQEHDIPYTCLPGPNAIIPALVMSGMPLHAFHFMGFLPQKKGRQTAWKQIAAYPFTTAFYESPHRLLKCLEEAVMYCGTERLISVVREISKVYEEVRRDNTSAVLAYYQSHPDKCVGEIVVVLHGAEE